MNEFELVDRFFRDMGPAGNDVIVGIGDDAAVVTVPVGQELVTATDTLVNEVHFPADFDPSDIAYRAAAVNLSDLAAMGATPRWATLALSLPQIEEDWLEKFSTGLGAALRDYGVGLIGGDTTRGPLTVTMQMMGLCPRGRVLRRDGAGVGDHVFVSGTLGDASTGRLHATGADEPYASELRSRFCRPQPRVALGELLRGMATSCIDISDGLLADLNHILRASNLGATLYWEAIPISDATRSVLGDSAAREVALTGGDDYELCFTLADEDASSALIGHGLPSIVKIGEVHQRKGLEVIDVTGAVREFAPSGYRHFDA